MNALFVTVRAVHFASAILLFGELVFVLVRSFIGIDSGEVPYPLLTFAALMPWTLFQESTADGVNSIVSNYALIRKIYFPREVFPVAAVAKAANP